MIQDETDFDKLYADAARAQTILIDALKTLPGDVADPGVKGRGSAERKLADKYTDKNGVPHPEKFRDLARATVLFENAADLLKVLTELDGGSLGLEIAQLKNKFASPTPLGYRDMNLNVSVRLDDGRKHRRAARGAYLPAARSGQDRRYRRDDATPGRRRRGRRKEGCARQ